VSETRIQVFNSDFLPFYIRPPVSIFMFLMLYIMLDGLILLHKSIDNIVQVGIRNSDITTDNPHYRLVLSVAISLTMICFFLNLP